MKKGRGLKPHILYNFHPKRFGYLLRTVIRYGVTYSVFLVNNMAPRLSDRYPASLLYQSVKLVILHVKYRFVYTYKNSIYLYTYKIN